MFALFTKFMQLVRLYHPPYRMFNNVSKIDTRVKENLPVPMQSQGEICVL